MAGTKKVLHLWKEFGLQVLVLLSFTIQVMLLILGELRQRMDSGVLKALVWSSYLLADSTAIYVLGHLSATSRLPEHQLMAFWAPFLLLHLGGQDSITAYAIEDNRLWLRHLQALAVQAAAAAYVLYESSIFGIPSLLLPATILMFMVGVVKYGEKVWALRSAGSSPLENKYRSFLQARNTRGSPTSERDMEALLSIAHLMLDVPKDWLKGPLPFNPHYADAKFSVEEVYKVVEIQLSLMHEVFYTKVEVMHTWYGFCIRIISSLATAIALLLFHVALGDHKDGYSRLDIAVTYVLLIGAVVLEVTSMLRVMFSSWTCAHMEDLNYQYRMKSPKKSQISKLILSLVASLRRLVQAAHWRKLCLGSMGQHNMVKLCARSRASRRSKIASWMGVEDWWNTRSYSWSVLVSPCVRKLMVMTVNESRSLSLEHIISEERAVKLRSWGIPEIHWSVEDSIIIWHIATDLYVRWYKKQQQADPSGWKSDSAYRLTVAEGIEAVELLSNYMLYLLAARPFMLPPYAKRNPYVETCYGLTGLKYSSAEDLASFLQRWGQSASNGIGPLIEAPYATPPHQKRRDSFSNNTPLQIGAMLGAKLIGEDQLPGSVVGDILGLLIQVWAGMLFYISRQVTAYSHGKQLSNGGELITVAALLEEYFRRDMISKTASPV